MVAHSKVCHWSVEFLENQVLVWTNECLVKDALKELVCAGEKFMRQAGSMFGAQDAIFDS